MMRPGMMWIWQIAAGSFGVAAAVLLVLGWVMLRYHRDRRQFQLMHAALERGLTNMPGAIPGWVLSLRQGTLSLVLGFGIIIAGAALHASAAHIEPASAISIPLPPGYENHPAPEMQPPPPPHFGDMRDNGRSPDGNPDGRYPPPQSPAMERWHRVETQKLIGLLSMCAGGILVMLGVVRIAFAKIERKYALDIPAAPKSGSEI